VRDDNFGKSVDISGDMIIVGASRFNPSPAAEDAGAAFIYRRDLGGAGNWGLVREILSDAPEPGQQLGISVAINDSIALVGASDIDSSTLPGFVLCYVRDIGTLDTWRFTDTLLPPDPSQISAFGHSVEVDRYAAAVGAPLDQNNPDAKTRAGAVYTAQLQISDPGAFARFSMAWQVANFTLPVVQDGTLEENIWGPGADPDRDTYTNAVEMLMGTDPNQEDLDRMKIRFEPLVGGSYSLIYQRAKNFPMEFVKSSWSSDLHQWGSGGVTETIETDLGSAEVIRATFGGVPQGRVFVRLVIGAQ
jgi:hypothetical protein